jgi:hypothetical protein
MFLAGNAVANLLESELMAFESGRLQTFVGHFLPLHNMRYSSLQVTGGTIDGL